MRDVSALVGLALLLVGASACGRLGYDRVDALCDCVDAYVDAASDADVGCGPSCRRVFVTSAFVPNAGFGSLDAGDAFCQARADAAALGGTFRAWLSDATGSPSTRFVQSAVPYVLTDGTVVAKSWGDLVDGALDHPIDHTELGTRATGDTEVWTGTTSLGQAAGLDCASWTNASSNTPYATVGTLDATDTAWSTVYLQFCDRSNVRLYCFEQ